MPPTIRLLRIKHLSSSTLLAFCAARTKLSVALMTAFPACWSLRVASVSPSAFTLQATSSCAVELATCFAEDINLSSLASPEN